MGLYVPLHQIGVIIALANILKRFYSVDQMLKKDELIGEPLTTREAYRSLINIALPSVAEMVLMSLIGSVDTMMVGTLGTDAIAAVGLVGQPRMLFLCIFFALNTGVTAIVARRKGQGLQAEANQTLRNALIMIIALAAALMAISIPLAHPLMKFAGAEDRTIGMASEYFRILMWFLPVNALTMCINAAQRGVGNTRITMYVNIAANVVNVIFNFLLIGGHFGFPALGVRGAAIATVIGMCVGFVLSIVSVLQNKLGNAFLHLSFRDSWKLDMPTVKAITKVGGNAMIEQIALRIGFFSYAKIVASLGTDAFAAHQVCMQFLNLSFTFGDGIGVAGTSLVGQMLGKKRPDLSKVYGKCSQRLAFTVAIILASCIVIFRHPLVSLFVDTSLAENAVVFQTASTVMFAVALFQPFQTSSVVLSGCLRGAGDTKFVAIIMTICVTCIRPVLSLFAIHVLGFDLLGAWCASLIDMALRMILVYRRFESGKWKNIKV